MKKTLSVFLAILMLAGCCGCIFASAEVDLTGYVKLKDPDTDTLNKGDWYFDWDALVVVVDPSLEKGTEEFEAYKAQLKEHYVFYYNPDPSATEPLVLRIDNGAGQQVIPRPDETTPDEIASVYNAYLSCVKHVPGSSGSGQTAKKLNFFQKIIEWFKNLFKKLFK